MTYLKDEQSSFISKRSQREILKVNSNYMFTQIEFRDIKKEKSADLRKLENELKKIQVMKELAATQAEIEAVTRVHNCSKSLLNIQNVSKIVTEGNTRIRVAQYVQS